MAHTIGGYTLYVTDDETVDAAIMAELEVINATSTVVQHFSKPSQRRTLRAYIITQTVFNNIKALSSGSAAVNYTSDQGSQGNYYINGVQGKRQKGQPMGFDGASSTDAVYLATIEMIKA